MKGIKPFTYLMSVSLVLGLGSCSNTKTISENPTEVLTVIKERGAATDSWVGLSSNWETHFDYYLDLSEYGLDSNWYDDYDSYYYTYSERATYKDELLIGISEDHGYYGYDEGEICIIEYVEGEDSWYSYDGYVVDYPSLREGATLDYYLDTFKAFFEASEMGIINNLILFDDGINNSDSSFEGFSISGYLKEYSDTTQRAYIYIEYDYEGEGIFGPCHDIGNMSLTIDYDTNEDISFFNYTYNESLTWLEKGETDITTQTITYTPFDEDVERPSWVS